MCVCVCVYMCVYKKQLFRISLFVYLVVVSSIGIYRDCDTNVFRNVVVLTFELRERDGFIEGLYVVFSCLVGCSSVF